MKKFVFYLRPNRVLALILCIVCGPTVADEAAPRILSAAEIRLAFETASVSWTPIPKRVLVAFAAEGDPNFFDGPPEFSFITKTIARYNIDHTYPRLAQSVFTSVLTIAIGDELSRQEILNWYANRIYLGQNCHGVSDASYAYFGRPVYDLRLEEYAFLASIPKAPSSFHPRRNVERATLVRNRLLRKLGDMGVVSEEQVSLATESRLIARNPLGKCDGY